MTITQIASAAGVSIGTVDRVIHGRGRVAPETARRVEEAIARFGYRTNPLARHLKLNRAYVIGLLLPLLDSEDGYWRLVFEGMQRAEGELKPFSIRMELAEFDRTVPGSCLRAARTLAGKADALIVAPLVPGECGELLTETEGLPFAFIDSELPGYEPAAVFAQNPFQGGMAAGRVMQLLVPQAKRLASFQMHSSAFNSRERSRGFLSFLAAHSQAQVMEISYSREHTEEGLALFWDDFFAVYGDIEGIFVVNDAVHRLGAYLRRRGLKEKIALVGYDLIEQNRRGLQDGLIDCLISQRPEFQGYSAVYGLYRREVLGQEVEPVKVPIDIYFKENEPSATSLQLAQNRADSIYGR